MASLTINSNPQGADIYISYANLDDLNYEGTTPFKINSMPTGTFNFEAIKEGYDKAIHLNWKMGSSNKTINFDLTGGGIVGAVLQKFIFTPKTDEDISLIRFIFGALKAELGAVKLLPGVEVQIPVSAKIAAGLIATGGLAGATVGGTTLGGVGLGTIAKGATAVAGINTIMLWMAEDNILTGIAFTLRKLREAVKIGAISQRKALEEAADVQTWIDAATDFVKISIELNPLVLPFKQILLLNARKAQKDFDLEVALIKETFPKK